MRARYSYYYKMIKMKTTIKFPQSIITQKTAPTKIATLIAVVLISIVLIISVFFVDYDTYPILSTTLILAALTGFILSAILPLTLKQAVHTQSNSPVICKIIYFKESKLSDVLAAAANSWDEIPAIAEGGKGVSMKIELVCTKDKSFAAYQIFKYIPYDYVVYNPIVYLNNNELPC